MPRDFDNGLDMAQAERIAYLMEECAEVIHACSKILRHGFDSTDPTSELPPGERPTNRIMLEAELSDVIGAMFLLEKNSDISSTAVYEKFSKRPPSRYLHHQR